MNNLRLANCTFETLMPFYQQEKIGYCNWGLVNGKPQTICTWEDSMPSGAEPEPWFHDILRPAEADLIRELTHQT